MKLTLNCRDMMNRYLELDNQDSLPLLLRLHVFFCHSCRNEIERMEDLFGRMEHYADSYPCPDMNDRILSVVRSIEIEAEARKTTPIRYWLSAGFLMFLATIIVLFTKPMVQLRLLSGETIDLPLNIICCVGLTIFLAVFIGSHMEEVSKFFKVHRSHTDR